jgi:TonB family protein
MPESARLPRLLAALSLTIPLLSAAQAPVPALSDLERARRDAEKVLSFIKFQTVKTKPAAEPGDKPRKLAAPAPQRPAAVARPAEITATAEPVVPTHAPAQAATNALQALDPVAPPPPQQPIASFSAPATQPATQPSAAVLAAETETEPEADDHEEVPLQIQRFIAPVLSRSVQATLVGGSRKVTVRFTVEANGTVSKAEAAADVPRRFARPATDAVLQWRFAPLPQPRTVDVEIDFKRDSSG